MRCLGENVFVRRRGRRGQRTHAMRGLALLLNLVLDLLNLVLVVLE
jgi:hypothetical protein